MGNDTSKSEQDRPQGPAGGQEADQTGIGARNEKSAGSDDGEKAGQKYGLCPHHGPYPVADAGPVVCPRCEAAAAGAPPVQDEQVAGLARSDARSAPGAPGAPGAPAFHCPTCGPIDAVLKRCPSGAYAWECPTCRGPTQLADEAGHAGPDRGFTPIDDPNLAAALRAPLPEPAGEGDTAPGDTAEFLHADETLRLVQGAEADIARITGNATAAHAWVQAALDYAHRTEGNLVDLLCQAVNEAAEGIKGPPEAWTMRPTAGVHNESPIRTPPSDARGVDAWIVLEPGDDRPDLFQATRDGYYHFPCNACRHVKAPYCSACRHYAR